MRKISLTEGLQPENAEAVCAWTNPRGADFLEQWAGPRFTFPLTAEQLQGEENFHSVFLSGVFVGVIQKIRAENGNVHIGRFLVDPEQTGKGVGRSALTAFLDMIFAEPAVHSITLAVFADNVNAKNLYESLGFTTYEISGSPRQKHLMKRMRDQETVHHDSSGRRPAP